MAEENNTPTPVEADEPGRKLDTLGDVRRALANTCRKIENGRLDSRTGHTLVIGLATLAKVMQDQRDSLWVKRARVLWAERQRVGAESDADH